MRSEGFYANEKNPLTSAGIEPATFRFVAQHLNHCATLPRSATDNLQAKKACAKYRNENSTLFGFDRLILQLIIGLCNSITDIKRLGMTLTNQSYVYAYGDSERLCYHPALKPCLIAYCPSKHRTIGLPVPVV